MMTTDLRKEIQSLLKEKHTKVYFNKADDKEEMPYVVFDLPFTTDNYNRDDYTLEVDIWDDSSDTSTIEDLTDSIDGGGSIFEPTGLNRLTLNAAAFTATFERVSRQSIEDNDKTINRRRLIYTVKVYRK